MPEDGPHQLSRFPRLFDYEASSAEARLAQLVSTGRQQRWAQWRPNQGAPFVVRMQVGRDGRTWDLGNIEKWWWVMIRGKVFEQDDARGKKSFNIENSSLIDLAD